MSTQQITHNEQQTANCFFDYKHVGGRFVGLVSVALVSLIASIVIGMQDPRQFAFSWLFAFFFFIPLIFVAPILWPWMTLPHGSNIQLIEKSAYLNLPFFWIRAAFYFLFFSVVSFWFRRLSVAQDKTGDSKYTVMARRITFASLPFFAVCLTFAAVD